jgi:SAM-dependent methyltransferase
MSDALVQQFHSWQNGIGHELAFWQRYINARGGPWAHDFIYRIDPDGIIHGRYTALFETSAGRSVRILDVGAGPLTLIGKRTVNGLRPEIVAVDPLAPFYDRFLAEASFNPPVRTQQAFAEDITAAFAPRSFDLVTSINALDHSFDPVRAIWEMLAVSKLGGAVYLDHVVNEAENENYVGFHQWNFDCQNGQFIIWNRSSRFDVGEEIKGFAKVETLKVENSHIVVTLRKTAESCSDSALAARHRARLQAVMASVLGLWAGAAEETSPS